MVPDTLAVKKLYERRVESYRAFIGFFRTRRGLQALLENSELLRPHMRVLDAGCGTGTATFALLDALKSRHLTGTTVDAFDLTPAMLSHFRAELETRRDARIELREADILDDTTLPRDWTGYDLIVSTSMLEYLPRGKLAHALTTLRTRLVPRGQILVMITRKSPVTKLLIEWAWHAERYSKSQLQEAFEQAGFEGLQHLRFPLRYGWQNRANHVVVARRPDA